jgi:hypothetical protein
VHVEIRVNEIHALVMAKGQVMDEVRVAYFFEHLDGAEPVVVFARDGELNLAIGFHRVRAAQLLRRTHISAEMRFGNRHQAAAYRDIAERTPWSTLAAASRKSRSTATDSDESQ